MPKFKIGNYELKYGLMLAPMAGVTDYAFRRVSKKCGAEFMVSEMLSCDAIHFKDKKTAQLAKITDPEMPMALQIFGCEPEIMAEAAALLEANTYNGCVNTITPAAIDINMGCPVPKVAGNGKGSALMRDPKRARAIIEAVVGAVSIPVTVKIRAGWDDKSKNAVELAAIAEEAGASLVCVHGRTRAQMYQMPVDLDIIAEVKRHLTIPVVGNGGINSAADAIHMFEYTGCDGIMVARGAEGNPWIFSEIIAALEGETYRQPSLRTRLDMALLQLDMLVEDKGEVIGTMEARKHLAWYIKGIDGAASLRDKINRTETYARMREMIMALRDKNGLNI